ncbi:Glyoxal reductase [Megamonas hypermegale]|uniref:Glyoxal reductase n=1 Tax=Megamonas hypermegale TaxID=158847 RepID=A0A378NRH1_9FIRM|nr:aldo/keto reductase [Megamonas hypermegale]STY70993.1 Glyoxal reductase [Megamonas hypermegale]
MDKLTLNNQATIPLTGLGVYQINNLDECEHTILNALKMGYRLIDTAACYGNEKAVGNAIKKSQIPRKDIFISSKVWIQDAGYQKTKQSFVKTLENLQTDYLDLYLIHMPFGDYHGSWQAMEELYASGKIKAIGVCNFLPDRLVDLILSHNIIPAINQIEFHLLCQQQELLKLMKKYDIKPMAWAPFIEGKEKIFENHLLISLAKKYNKTTAQIILKWLRQNNIISIPKSTNYTHLQENIQLNNFTLTAEELDALTQLDKKHSIILDLHDINEVYRLHNIKFIQ